MKKTEKRLRQQTNFMTMSLAIVYIVLILRLSTILYLNLVYHITYHTDLISTFIIYFSMRLVILLVDNHIKQKEKDNLLSKLFEDHDE